MAMSNSVWAFLCLFTAVSAFHPHTNHLKWRPCRHSAVVRQRRGRVFHLELPTPIPSGFVNADIDTRLDTKANGSNHYKDLLGSFSTDLDRLTELRPPIAAADISAEKTIISAGSSYTRLWTHSSWRRHATPPHVRYARHVWRWRLSTTARRILPAVLMSVVWATCVSLIVKSSPRLGAAILSGKTGASASVSALSAPLALLLTLRANASMTRLLEARLAWGSFTLHSRSIANLLQVYLLPLEPEASILAMRHLSILGWLLKARLRDESEESQQQVLQTMLSGEDYSWLSSQQDNRPIAITSRLRQITAVAFDRTPAGITANNPLAFVEERIHQLETALGVVERIFSSPIPPTYSRHLSRVMSLWLFFLPINLVSLGLTTSGVIVATMIAAYTFIGLDEVGMEIERPSVLLPLQQLAASIQNAVRDQAVMEGGGGMPKVP